MATISTDITNIPLRKIFRTVDDDTFKTALVSLSKKELTLLKRIYGKTYEELNVIPLSTEETKDLLELLNTKMPEKFRMISEYKQKEKQKKAHDDYFNLASKAKGYDPRLWESLYKFLNIGTDFFKSSLDLTSNTAYALYFSARLLNFLMSIIPSPNER